MPHPTHHPLLHKSILVQAEAPSLGNLTFLFPPDSCKKSGSLSDASRSNRPKFLLKPESALSLCLDFNLIQKVARLSSWKFKELWEFFRLHSAHGMVEPPHKKHVEHGLNSSGRSSLNFHFAVGIFRRPKRILKGCQRLPDAALALLVCLDYLWLQVQQMGPYSPMHSSFIGLFTSFMSPCKEPKHSLNWCTVLQYSTCELQKVNSLGMS